ncbi:MAG: hypothetical protein CVV02_15815 [Firmicutes bacterium HGW-Firmicutes-7]|nr:MAG: hypothetical protein CVV02_15815 [Firmicutes bacterium HGW-Firmicutes-7]
MKTPEQLKGAIKNIAKDKKLLREISWTNNLMILSKTKANEERELRVGIKKLYDMEVFLYHKALFCQSLY